MIRFSIFLLLFYAPLLIFAESEVSYLPDPSYNLQYTYIPDRWDRAFPLGNGMVGVLVWQHNGMLRLSINRADLWDLRPMADLDKYSYQWAYEHRLNADWDTVQRIADYPYDHEPGPTKLPGAAIEFDISKLGDVETATLSLASAICTIKWKSGVVFKLFADANSPAVYYSWTGIYIKPVIVPPPYIKNEKQQHNQVSETESNLWKLGYRKGKITRKKNSTVYKQPLLAGNWYEVACIHSGDGTDRPGCISISTHVNDGIKLLPAHQLVKNYFKQSFDQAAESHKKWWLAYWNCSRIEIPDHQLQKQYLLDMYKFGSASRKGAPPISLQAIWTADNGMLPPWHDDFHNDLNTQLSYWPSYISNHTDEASVFTNWLWEHKKVFETYTSHYFGAGGLNVPGVATVAGEPMGGWHMYSLSPTTAAWLSQHFYLQWRYTMDRNFLQNRAYPWFAQAADFIENITVVNDGVRRLPMSSSPEFRDNRMDAWFLTMTNYDLALCRFLFEKAAELATELRLTKEANHYHSVLSQFEYYALDADSGLAIAAGVPLHESHRHFSHLMAFHPLGLLNFFDPDDKVLIERSILNLEKQGNSAWLGYSYSWLANMYALMGRGEDAAKTLKTFASCYCSPNSFHLNNNQCKRGNDDVGSDPFTLEGNFASAAALQEMMLQSRNGFIRIFPAVPSQWRDVNFNNLLAEGAFLVSGSKHEGVVDQFVISAPEGGIAHVVMPFPTFVIAGSEKVLVLTSGRKEIVLQFEKGGMIIVKNGYE